MARAPDPKKPRLDPRLAERLARKNAQLDRYRPLPPDTVHRCTVAAALSHIQHVTQVQAPSTASPAAAPQQFFATDGSAAALTLALNVDPASQEARQAVDAITTTAARAEQVHEAWQRQALPLRSSDVSFRQGERSGDPCGRQVPCRAKISRAPGFKRLFAMEPALWYATFLRKETWRT